MKPNHKTQNPNKHSHMLTSIAKCQSPLAYFPYKHQKIQGMVASKTNKFRSFQTQEKINSIDIAMALSISKTTI